MTFTALAASVLIVTGHISATPPGLPNDCAIVATEAHARLAPNAVWARVMTIRVIDIKTLTALGHVVVVWQINKDGAILVYDATGTLTLETHSQKAFDIAAALNKTNPQQPIYEATFIQ